MRELGLNLFTDHAGYAFASRRALVRTAGGVLVGCFLMSLAAQVKVPVPGTTVPMTLQSFAVLLVGFALEPSRAAAAMLLYLACGACGLPVFAPGSAGLAGETGGYIVGFVLAASVISLVRGRGEAALVRSLQAGTVGLMVLFVCGVGWRAVWSGGDVRFAVVTGLLPFVVKAVVELLLALTLVTSVRGLRRRSSP